MSPGMRTVNWKATSLASTFLAALLGISPRSVQVSANPIQTSAPRLEQVPFEDVYNELTNATLVRRGNCANPCGWSGQLCCGSSEQCYTDTNNQAQCGAGATSSGYWQYYTTTIVDTETLTRTVTTSSWYGGSGGGAVATGSISCNSNKGESACGSICCTSEQYCMLSGQCAAVGATNSPGVTATGTAGSYSAPLRPTSGTLIVVTATESPTTTVPYESPVATGASGIAVSSSSTGGGGGGLSGGEIAGIVIGVLAGIFLLGLLILFLCAKAAFDGLLALFGFGRKKRVRETTIQERYRHSSGGSRHSGWYGDRPPPPRPVERRPGVGAGGILAGLGAIGAALGLSKARRDRVDEKSTTSYGSSYYYSDYTSTSKSSDHPTDKCSRYNQPRQPAQAQIQATDKPRPASHGTRLLVVEQASTDSYPTISIFRFVQKTHNSTEEILQSAGSQLAASYRQFLYFRT
ncbi:uncharacterized protein BKA78DRAFT_141013 [Phyllosticta capitalensis]|uniref:uncharacterized protein n=1 Tax=Phyllosticta capitalensis TaxID=121624 RepID=UPI0031321156